MAGSLKLAAVLVALCVALLPGCRRGSAPPAAEDAPSVTRPQPADDQAPPPQPKPVLQKLADLPITHPDPNVRYDLVYSSRHYIKGGGPGHSHYQIRRLSLVSGRSVELTHGDVDCSYPVPSPDGRQIAYVNSDGLWLMSASGGSPRRVRVVGGHWSGVQPVAWTSDGRRLVADASAPPEGKRGVCVIEVATGQVHRIVDCWNPTPSPAGGTRILAYTGPDGNPGLSDLQGRKLWNCVGAGTDWMPGGDRVVVSPDTVPGVAGALAVLRANDGSQIASYPVDGVLESAWDICRCSPKGDDVIVGGRGGDCTAGFQRFYTLSLRTGKETLLGVGDEPSWAPNGRYVAWCTPPVLMPLGDGRVVYTAQVAVYDTQTRKYRRLTSGLQWNRDARWLRCG